MRKAILLLLLFVSCSHQERLPAADLQHRVDKIVDHIQDDFGLFIAYPVIVTDIPDRYYGYCDIGAGKHVKINRVSASSLSYRALYILVLHEISHCSLNLRHYDKKMADGCPATFMHSSLHEKCCERHFFLYLEIMRETLRLLNERH